MPRRQRGFWDSGKMLPDLDDDDDWSGNMLPDHDDDDGGVR